jgi:hypothetical protein
VWTGAAYEQLGDVGVDLSGYVSKADLAGDNGDFMVGKNMQVGADSVTLNCLLDVDYLSGVRTLAPAARFDIGSCISILTDDDSTNQTELVLGDATNFYHGIKYTYNTGDRDKMDILHFGPSSMLTLGTTGEFRCGNDDNGIRILRNSSGVDTLYLGHNGGLRCGDDFDGIQMYTDGSGVATLSIGSKAKVIGLSGGGGDNNHVDVLYVNTVYPLEGRELAIYAHVTGIESLGVGGRIGADCFATNNGCIRLGYMRGGTALPELYLGEGVHITGPGWEEMQAAAAATAATAATAAESEQPSFTKLTFPPTGTATAEQDPSWITKSHILMQTNGGQLNMTQLTATLAYAAQTPLSIAKRTLWLSTSPGTGDAVQWPANAVFPDDQPQDKIQQLNSNSTYWFDITYVGGSDTVLIRKVCSWASTTGESGPTE